MLTQLFARYDGTNAAFYLTDNLGSVRQIVNVSGTVLDQITYDSFGNILTETNSGNGDRFKFASREWQSELGLYANRERFYNPAAGRWDTQDPSSFGAGDPNLYGYITNDPVMATDPSGLETVSISFKINNVACDLFARSYSVGGYGMTIGFQSKKPFPHAVHFVQFITPMYYNNRGEELSYFGQTPFDLKGHEIGRYWGMKYVDAAYTPGNKNGKWSAVL